MVHTNKKPKKNQKNFTGKETLPPKEDDTCTSKPGGKRKTTVSTFVRLDTCNFMKNMENRTGAQTSLWTVCLNVFLGGQKQKRDNAFHSLFGRGREGRFTQRFLVCRPSTWRLTCLSSVIPFWCIQSWTTFPHRSRRTSVRLLKIH